MVNCPSCGSGITADASFCGQCGFNMRAYSEAVSAARLPSNTDVQSKATDPSSSHVDAGKVITKKRNNKASIFKVFLWPKFIFANLKKVLQLLAQILPLKTGKKTKNIFPFTRDLIKYKFEIPLKPIFRFSHEPISIESSLPFIGRQAELNTLVERILFSNGGSFLVTGYRGVGKSSFVNQVVRNLEAALPWAERYLGKTEIIAVQLNLARPLEPSKLMYHIIRRLYEKLIERDILTAFSPDLQEQLSSAYRRTSFNMTRNTIEGLEHNFGINEFSLEAGKLKTTLKPSLGYKRTNTQNYQASFLDYDDKAAEYDVIEISRRLANGYIKPQNLLQQVKKKLLRQSPQRIKLKIIFVFDEMDKLEDIYLEENGTKKLFIESLLGSLKNLFTTSGISFIFIAGKDLHERWLEDLGRGDSIYESVFAYDKYLPCMWTNINELCDTFVDQEVLGRKSTFNSHDSRWDEDEALLMFEDFKNYLYYKGRGLPRRIIRGFNEYVQWNDQKPILVFTHQDARRIRFYAGLQNVLSQFMRKFLKNVSEESLGSQQDKQQLGIYYLVDWVLRQQNREFSLNHAINASKQLSAKIALIEEVAPQIIRDILELLLQSEYLQEVKSELNQAQILNVNIQPEKLYQLPPRRINEMSGVADIYDEEANLLRQVDNITTEIGYYKLQEKIGVGGMATIYKAWDEQNTRYVAVKILTDSLASNPQAVKRFKREAEIMSNLEHPNIVKYYDTGEAKRLFYIVMEYIDGINLSTFVEKLGKLDFNVAIHIIIPIVEALQYIHAKGFFRNDIKPGNILINSAGKVYLIDFGITKSYQGDMEVTGTILQIIGTPHYISPEQWQNNPANASSDIYSLGVTMYEMVAGKRPFEGDSLEDICQRHLHQLPIPPSRFAALPQPVETIILKCLEKNPSQRFQSIDELKIALNQIIHDQPRIDLAPLLKATVGEINYDIEFVSNDTEIPVLEELPPPTIAPITVDNTTNSLTTVTYVQYPYLRVLKGASAVGTIFPLKSERMKLGRSSESEIILNSNQISRFHARIFIENGNYCIEDFNSISGTIVNGSRIRDKYQLQNGDKIQIADFVLEFKQV
jgi:serine/threonine-protein kinase